MKNLITLLLLILLSHIASSQYSKDIHDFNICSKIDTDTLFDDIDSKVIDSMICIYLNGQYSDYLCIFKIEDKLFIHLYRRSEGFKNIEKIVISYKDMSFNFKDFFDWVFDSKKAFDMEIEDDTSHYYFKFKFGETYYTRCYRQVSCELQVFSGKYNYLDGFFKEIPELPH